MPRGVVEHFEVERPGPPRGNLRNVHNVRLVHPHFDVVPVLVGEIRDIEVIHPVADLSTSIGLSAAWRGGFVWMPRRRIRRELRRLSPQRWIRVREVRNPPPTPRRHRE